ncbi:MAG TPA: SDR family oxidoreductase [Ktedonobacterales bacterium]|nr:SDR family oxidoreductase [Ktedonobacterales bacterium]
MNIAVFGANGPTGQHLTKQALAGGHLVTAFTRHPEIFPIRHERLRVMQGDVFDSSAVEQAIAGTDAVLSTLGVPFSRKPISVYSQGITHIAQAMSQHGVRRLVCVSSSATDPHVDPKGGFIFERIVQPTIINTIGRTVYEDMRRMEKLVRESNLDWTIVRPSGLFETPEVTKYQMAEVYIRGRYTSRADLASCMLQQLTNDRYLRKIVAVATTSIQPSMLKLIVREAFQRRPN